MKLVMLTCEQPWQHTFAGRLAAQHDLELLIVDEHLSVMSRTKRITGMMRHPATTARKVIDKLALRSIERRDNGIYDSYFKKIGAPAFEQSAKRVFRTSAINGAEVAREIEAVKPDAIVVSGTRLIKSPVLNCKSRLGMINMHTGLSPYYRGGPCTFWSLYNEEPEYAGVTIHYLSAGIDSGDIILSGRPKLESTDGVASLDSKVIDTGHGLMLEALELLDKGIAPKVKNWEKGKLFLYKQFTAKVRLELESKLQNGLMDRCLRRLEQHPVDLKTITPEVLHESQVGL